MTTPVTKQHVADYFKSNMDFARFARLTKALGNQTNDAQLRFIKAWIFEQSVEEYSGSKIKYIGEEGCDLLIPALNDTRVEMKYVENALYTTAKKKLREHTGGIKLMNSMGTNSHSSLPKHYADFLLFVGNQGAILFDKATLEMHTKVGGDGITADIPTSDGIILATPEDMTGAGQTEVDFIKGFRAFLKSYIQSVK